MKKKNIREYSLEESDKLIVEHNEAVEAGNSPNSFFFQKDQGTKNISQKKTIPHVRDITIPAFKQYMKDFSERSQSSENPIANANGKPLEEIKKLLHIYKKSADIIYYKEEDGNTHIHLAIATDSQSTCLPQLIKALIKAPITPAKANNFGMEAHHMAIASGKTSILRDCLFRTDAGGDVSFYLRIWNENLEEEQIQAERRSSDSCDFS